MTITNSSFLDACNGLIPKHTPVWFMRQAGRYQAEYREIRKKHSLIEICKIPEVCAEVTLLPIEQLNVDAAILFSDITLPLAPMGVDFDIVEGIGPVIHNPITNISDIKALKPLDANETLSYVGKTIQILEQELSVPLIGFVGAPFTLASYMIEGGPSKNYYKVKAFMYNHETEWHSLMEVLSLSMAGYLRYQVQNGASAVQVFDSWVGALNESDYMRFVYPHMQSLFSQISDLGVPLIHFGVVNRHLLQAMYDVGATVVGLDWRTPLKEGRAILGNKVTLQGNLDPALLLANQTVLDREVMAILDQIDNPKFIFNLGHGIMPQANMDSLKRIVELVHAYKPNYDR